MKPINKKCYLKILTSMVFISIFFFQTNAVAHTAKQLFEAVEKNDKREVTIALTQCGCPSEDGIDCNYDSDGRCECRDDVTGKMFFLYEEDKNKMTDLDADKANVTTVDEQGRTILHIAAKNGYTEIIQIILQNHYTVIDAKDDLGNTPLYYAIKYSHQEAIKLLLDAGASLAIENKQGESPLSLLPSSNNESEDLIANCENRQTLFVLDSMAKSYKSAIGDDYYTSESDYQWNMFYSIERTPILEKKNGSVRALGELKKILFKEVYRIYPYSKFAGESSLSLEPVLEYLSDEEFVLNTLKEQSYDGQYAGYHALGQKLSDDFSRFWFVKVGMEWVEDEYPTAVKVVFVLGQTSCGHWVGLRTFSVET